MKRTRNLIIVAAVFVVLLAVIFAESKISEHIDSVTSTDEIILALSVDDLTAVSWTYEEETLSFTSADGVWQDETDADFPVDADAMAEFLANFAEIHSLFTITDVEDYSQYGLDEPQCVVTLTVGEQTYTLNLGGYSTMDAQRYASLGGTTVYLLEDDLLEYITTDRDDFLQNDSLPAYDDFVSLSISGDVSLNAVYDAESVYSYTDDYNYYETSADYLTLDDATLENYVSLLDGLSFTDYASYTASSVTLADYGLENPALTITVTGTVEPEEEDGEAETVAYTLNIGVVEVVTEEEADEESENAEEAEPTYVYYLRVGESEMIYNLDSTTCEAIAACSYNDLRPTAVVSPDWDTLQSLSVTIGDESYEISLALRSEIEELEEDEEDETLYLLDSQEVDISTLTAKIDALYIHSFVDEAAEKVLEMSFSLTLDRESYPTVSVEIYQYDSENCLVYVDGQSVGLITRTMMVNLREAMTSLALSIEE
ncbi:MAG: DUF4340 domain-containing protein [Firmicutes bacterium]|nr:DUF4340 domain-containing protein [Bacillota bacterium]